MSTETSRKGTRALIAALVVAVIGLPAALFLVTRPPAAPDAADAADVPAHYYRSSMAQ